MFTKSIGTTTTAASGFPIWAIVVIVVAAVAGALLIISAALVIVCVCCCRRDTSRKKLPSENGTVDKNEVPPVLVVDGSTPVLFGSYYTDKQSQAGDRELPARPWQAPNPHAPGQSSRNHPSTGNTSGIPEILGSTVGVPAGQRQFTVSQLPSGSGQYKQYQDQDIRSIKSDVYQNDDVYLYPDELDTARTAGVSATGGQSEGEGERRAPPDRPVDPEAVGPDGNKIGNKSKVQ